MTDIHPLLGLRVLYTLSEQDRDQIVQRRRAAGIGTLSGNDPRPGDVFPAVIVRVWSTKAGEAAGITPHVNLQVLLDGNDAHWVTSRSEFDATRDGRHAGYDDPEEPTWIPDSRGHWTRRG